jgi:hypothetical protein
MRKPTHRHALALFLSAFAAPWLFAGCGSQAAAICAETCNCSGCSSDLEQECIARIQGSEMVAGEVGCGSEASDYEACYEGGTCIAGAWMVDGCVLQQNAIVACLAKSHCTVDALGGVHCS